MSSELLIHLDQDQAIVLFELFARSESTSQLQIKYNAEYIALSAISAQLQRSLSEPFSKQYDAELKAARARVELGFEGTAPWVST